MAEFLLAGPTLERPVAIVALLTLGFSFCGTLTVADEVQNDLHLLSETQRFNFNGLALAVRWTLLSFNGNLEKDLEARGPLIQQCVSLSQSGKKKSAHPTSKSKQAGIVILFPLCYLGYMC